AALFRLHRQAEHRGRQLEWPRVHVRVLGRVVQDVVELDLIDLGDGADVARDGLVHLGLGLPAQHVQVARLDGLPPFADVELHVGGEPPLVHAEHGDAADVGVDLDLEDVSERVFSRIGKRRELLRLPAAGGGTDIDGGIALGRIGQQLDDDFQQLLYAGAGPGGGEQHRN